MKRTLILLCALLAAVIGHPRAALAEAPVAAVVPVTPRVVAPRAAAAVTRELYGTVARLGYQATPEGAVAGPASRLSANPVPAELAQLGALLGADHTLYADVGAEQGRYVVTLTVAHADGATPYVGRATATAADLEAVTESLVRSALAPASPAQVRTARAPRAGPATSRLALQTEGAVGLTRPGFYNHLLGARYDHAVTSELALGGALAYVNLKGKQGRAHNLLPSFQLEYRLRGAEKKAVQFPLRFSSGYLPRNGPVLRVAAGLSFPVGETTRLGLDLLAPTFWVVRDSLVVSANVALELSFAL